MSTVAAVVTLRTVGADVGDYIDVYSNADGYCVPVYVNAKKTDLLAGFIISNIPDYATNLKLISKGPTCYNSAIVYLVQPSPTPTITPTQTISLTPSITPSITATISLTPTISVTKTATISLTPTRTASISVTPTITPTISISPTRTVTPTISVTATITPTISVTPTISITPSVTKTPTISVTPTITITPTISRTPTITPPNPQITIYQSVDDIINIGIPPRIWYKIGAGSWTELGTGSSNTTCLSIGVITDFLSGNTLYVGITDNGGADIKFDGAGTSAGVCPTGTGAYCGKSTPWSATITSSTSLSRTFRIYSAGSDEGVPCP